MWPRSPAFNDDARARLPGAERYPHAPEPSTKIDARRLGADDGRKAATARENRRVRRRSSVVEMFFDPFVVAFHSHPRTFRSAPTAMSIAVLPEIGVDAGIRDAAPSGVGDRPVWP